MNTLPLHPAIVHLPVGLALLMPLFAAGFALALWKEWLGPRAWTAVVALQALLLASALVAINTGGSEEDRVERLVPKGALQQHEAFADQFTWASGATLGLAALVLVLRRPGVSRALAAATVVATFAVTGLGLRVGHAGGQLVYVHGAAAAYLGSSGAAQPSEGRGTSSAPAPQGGRNDDDDDRKR